MKPSLLSTQRVMAIDPSIHGFGFAVLEGPKHLIDWGAKTVKGDKNTQSLKRIAELIEYYLPEVIIIEDYQDKGARRCGRVQELIDDIVELTIKRRIKAKRLSQRRIKKVFSSYDAKTKQEIAQAIVQQYPELTSYLPRPRKAWMIEDNRMNIFDALALALAFFYSYSKPRYITKEDRSGSTAMSGH